MLMKRFIKIAFCLSMPMFFACNTNGEQKNSNDNTVETIKKETALAFDSNEAYKEIEKQISFGFRIPGTKEHIATRDYLKTALEERGLSVVLQEFDGTDYFAKKVKGYNILGKLNPEIKKRVLLLAHWDSRQVSDQESSASMQDRAIVAADDGASGVAVILEILRQIKLQNINDIGIDVAFVDIEDAGKDGEGWCQGSEYYAKSIALSDNKPKYGILLDMVGATDAVFALEQYSKMYAEVYQDEIWTLAGRLEHSKYFKKELGGAITDDHVPIIKYARIPCLDIINYNPQSMNGFANHWHTQKDNIDIIDKATLQAVGETVLTYIVKNK